MALLELPIACARVAWGANLWLLTVMGLGAFMLTVGSLLALLASQGRDGSPASPQRTSYYRLIEGGIGTVNPSSRGALGLRPAGDRTGQVPLATIFRERCRALVEYGSAIA